MSKMKISVGIDIEEVKRFRTAVRDRAFLRRVFMQDEILYYKSKRKNPQTLAGIFAAKEAVVKALSQLLGNRYSVGDFVILHDKTGAPFLIEARTRKVPRLPRGLAISLSISHTSAQALAVAFVQQQ
jgi:holo-[acyl-carrier protein] synthase